MHQDIQNMATSTSHVQVSFSFGVPEHSLPSGNMLFCLCRKTCKFTTPTKKCVEFVLKQRSVDQITDYDNSLTVVFCHRYSTDGGFTWETYIFSTTAILARDIVTQPGERLPIFLIYGNRARAWTVFYLNMTNVLGVCTCCYLSTLKVHSTLAEISLL